MNWLTVLVGLGAFVGSVIRMLPNVGWLHNRLIPRWIQITTYIVAFVHALQEFNRAAGLGLVDMTTVHYAGFALSWKWLIDVIVIPLGQAWIATWITKKGYDEANKAAQRPEALVPAKVKVAK